MATTLDPALAALGAVPTGQTQTNQVSVPTSAQQTQPATTAGTLDPALAALGAVPTSASPTTQNSNPITSNASAPAAPSSGPIPTFFLSSPSDTAVTAPLKTVANIPTSAANFGINLAESPFKSLSDISQIPGQVAGLVKDAGGVGSALKSFGSTLLPSLYNVAMPDIAKQGVKFAAGGLANLEGPIFNKPGAGNALMDSGISDAQSDMTNDPVGSILPFLMLGREAAYKASPEAGAAFDSGVAKVGSTGADAASLALKPATATLSGAASLAGNVAKFTFGKAAGLEPSTIDEVMKNGADTTLTRPDVAAIIQKDLATREDNLSESGQAYAPIKASPNMIDVSSPKQGTAATLAQIITKNTGLVQGPDGTFESNAMSPVDAPGDVSKVNRFYQQWQPYFEQGQMTNNEFLTMRGKLGKIANFQDSYGKSVPLDSAAQGMYHDLNTNFRDQIPGLDDLDADFSSQKGELKELSSGILDKEGKLTDAAINKIANAGNNTRTVFLSKLEDISPGITRRIRALAATEDIEKAEGNKIGTYARAGLGPTSVIAGVATGSVPLIVSGITEAILASPKVSVPLLRAYGFSREIVGGVLANLKSAGSAVNQLPNGSQASLGALTPQLRAGMGVASDYFQKNPVSLGLSMRDVSNDADAYDKNDTVKITNKETGQSQIRTVQGALPDKSGLSVNDPVSGIPRMAHFDKWDVSLLKKGEPDETLKYKVGDKFTDVHDGQTMKISRLLPDKNTYEFMDKEGLPFYVAQKDLLKHFSPATDAGQSSKK